MTAIVIGILVIAMLVAGLLADRRRKVAAREQAADDLRQLTAVAEEDVTRFGEELQDLHIETLTTELDVGMRQDYQRALDAYEDAKQLLAAVEKPESVAEVTKALEDGRYAMACVLARQAGEALPTRLPPCFFNPQHGPSTTEVEWAPPGGVPREVPVCAADAERLAAGAEPDTRMVKSGDRRVPWYEGGPAYRPYADGYFTLALANGMFTAAMFSALMAGSAFDTGYDGVGLGELGGGDGGGGDGGDGGGFDGFDFGDFGF